MEFYRYELRQYLGDIVHLKLRTYTLIEETPKGYWIGIGTFKFKWIPKSSRRRYAFPTKEEALISYKKRTSKRIGILKHHISLCNTGLTRADEIEL